MGWVGAVYAKRPSPTPWDVEISVTADRARRVRCLPYLYCTRVANASHEQCTAFLQADRLGIRLTEHQYKVAAEEKGLRNRTDEEVEADWLEGLLKNRMLERTLYWIEKGSK
jgi:hypothetical protein